MNGLLVSIGALIVLLLSGCMVKSMPDSSGGVSSHATFLQDAAATCGNPVMLMPEGRDFEATTTLDRTNKIYDCVNGYLAASPEYRTINEPAKASDRRYIEAMRQVDLQRAAGRLSATQAQAVAQQAANAYAGKQ